MPILELGIATPSAWACRGMIRAYQITLSPYVPTQCLFTPTCSHYGLGCIRRYGTLRGGILTTWRLIHCSPLTKGGFDPVPGDEEIHAAGIEH